jgi:hypothetical protein
MINRAASGANRHGETIKGFARFRTKNFLMDYFSTR